VHNPSQDGWAGDLKNTTWTITGCSGRKRSQCIDRKRVCGRKIYLATGHQLLLILNWHSIKIFCKLSFYLRHATLRPTLRGSYWSSCYSIFNFMCMFCRSLFVLFLSAIVLSVLHRYMVSSIYSLNLLYITQIQTADIHLYFIVRALRRWEEVFENLDYSVWI
jgi:hypothetical protein